MGGEGADKEQYLTFQLAGEEYAIAIIRVREIIGYASMTRVPMTPPYIRGVINLRGSVVPVVDLAQKFGLPAGPVTKLSCIIVLDVDLQGEQTVMGIMADTVRQVIDLSPQDIESPPAFGPPVRVEYLKGLGKIENRFVLILDINQVLSSAESMDLLSLRNAVQDQDEAKKEGNGQASGPPRNQGGSADPSRTAGSSPIADTRSPRRARRKRQ